MMSVLLPRAHFLALFLFSSLLAAQPPEKSMDQMIRQGIADWEVPGMVTAVVRDGKVVFSEAYGVKDLASGSRVDRQTLFNMGSTTKAMVCMALGVLVDRGQLQWEDRVADHLPEFELSDPYIRDEARVKDLLTHNLGISEADLIWFVDSTSTAEALKRFALAKKAYPVRGGFQYNNLMYAVAGEVIRAVSGKHWAEFVREVLFEPLEMHRTVARASEIFPAGNYVTPYYPDLEGNLHPVPYNQSDQIGAAGMIWTCLEDVEHYLQMLTQGGQYKGRQILSPETFAYLFEPHAFVPSADFYPTQKLTRPHWKTYGLGWFQHDYRGQKLDFHTGSITGLVAMAGVMHHARTAVYVLANRDHAELRHAILYKGMDLWVFGDDQRDWNGEILELYRPMQERTHQQEKALQGKRVAGTQPRLPLTGYTGTYRHPMLGTAEVLETQEGLELVFNGFARFRTTHWHYDTFRSDADNRYRLRLMAQFRLNPNGQVGALEVFGETFQREPEP
ncbi:serine hydrolase [Robiginitalea sp. M366]|uniref:serine hydrolase n=1 Tax=Robiginitalea aestuariiviva TaxID=3036903 RepID=UPI00240E78FD|nr:serine hydrolase [Robiginitalea aestuariiviva]MDG1571256.1 serine hydrolase [Robiginitalea aestuariiviva]